MGYKMNFDFHRRVHAPAKLNVALSEMEHAQLIRALQGSEPAYLFKHALVQDTAYGSLMKQDRRHLHHLVAETLEQTLAEQRDENAALLAYHFERAEEWDKALEYLQRAAEWARRGAAHLEEAELLARAIAIAEPLKQPARLANLHAQRGKAFASLTRWQDAKPELLQSLDLLPVDQHAARAQTLVELANVMEWLWDVATSKRYAQEALELAEQVGRDDLAASAMATLATAESSDGNTHAALEYFERASARAGEIHSASLVQGLAFSGLLQYFIGNPRAGIERSRTALGLARDMALSETVVFALGNLGLALVASGRYGDALETFREARAFAQAHDVGAFLARTIAIEGGLHLDLFDYAGAQALAEEARALARSVKFPGAIVSAAIDLLLNMARRGDVSRAQFLEREVTEAIPQAYGSHRWLWELRFTQAQAELALARGRYEEALAMANQAIFSSRKSGRTKYETLGLVALAEAHAALHADDAAHAALQLALERARANGNPSLFLHAALPLYQREHTLSLLQEIRTTVQRIHAALPASSVRDGFDAAISEWI